MAAGPLAPAPRVIVLGRTWSRIADGIGRWMACASSAGAPSEVHLDERGELHHLHGLAFRYPSGRGLHRWHGMDVPEDIRKDRKALTVERIERESNLELRRAMIECYDMARHLMDAKARVLSHDHAGILYRKRQGEDETLCMVRVPPTMKAASEAMA